MKEIKLLYIVIDGLGDLPISELDDKTPLEAAVTPNLNTLAESGKLGLMYTVGKGIAPESDVAVISILGYDPNKYYTGRGPIEAFGSNLDFNNGDLALRCNFATIDRDNNKIIDRRVGRNLTTSEATELSKSINSEIRLDRVPSKFTFKNTIGHRGVLVIKRIGGSLSSEITNTDPAYARMEGFGVAEASSKIEPFVKKCEPMDSSYESRISADLVNEFTSKTSNLLDKHPTNLERQKSGKLKANIILSRDAGNRLPQLFDISKKYGINFASIVEMPVERGIATLAGMKIIEVPPPSGNLIADSQFKVERILENLQQHDAFYIHIKGPDEPAHDGDYASKKRSIEIIDIEFFGRLLAKLKFDEFVICVTSDHSTPCKMKAHSDDPVPLLIAGGKIKSDKQKKFSESTCSKGSLGIIPTGSQLMPKLVSVLK